MPYQQLMQKFHEYFSRDANACVVLGLTERLDELPDISKEAALSRKTDGENLLYMIQACNRDELEFDQRLDLELAELGLKFSLFMDQLMCNGRLQSVQMPEAASGISDGLFLLFANDPRSSHERLDNITERIGKVPSFLQGMQERLDTPVKRWVEIDLEKTAELPDFFGTLVRWAQAEGYHRQEELEKNVQMANEALVLYREYLRGLPVTEKFAIGEEQTRQLVKLRGIEWSLEQLWAMARDYLQDLGKVTEELRRKLTDKYGLAAETRGEELLAFLKNRYSLDVDLAQGMTEVLKEYQKEKEKILAFVEERDLFSILSDQAMEIIATPKFMESEIPAGAMMSPPPFRSGRKVSLIYLTLREDLMNEHTKLSIPLMMIHEGIPGHHLQLATAFQNPSLVRKHIEAMDQAEGWATMLEDYMLDQGYMGDLTDEARFCGKWDIGRIGARVAIDLYFMTGDPKFLDIGIPGDYSDEDPFVNAGRLLQAVTGFSAGRVEAELNWYSQSRGYPLSYLAGNQMVWQLKEELRVANPGIEAAELDKIFHRIYLEAGCMPVSYVRKVFGQKDFLRVAF